MEAKPLAKRPALRPLRWLRHPLTPWLGVVGVVLFFTNVYPLLELGVRALTRDGLLALDNLTVANLRWLTSVRVRAALGHSLLVSSAAALFALVGGALLALVTTRTDVVLRRAIQFTFLTPLIVPPQVLAIAWLQWAGPVGYVQAALRALTGRQGQLWSLYGPGGVVFLLTLFVLPIAFLTLVGGLQRLGRDVEEAASLDGASSLEIWGYIVLPLLRPHLSAAVLLCFLGALGNFGIPALLAIPARYSTLPTLLYQEVVSFSAGGLGRAAALALLFGLPATVALWLQGQLLTRSESRSLGESGPTPGLRLERWRWPLSISLWLLSLLLVIGPLFAMGATALLRAYGLPLLPENLTLEHFAFILTLGRAQRAAWHSFVLALGAALLGACLAVVLGYTLTRLRGRLLVAVRLSIDLPYALPGLIFALALILVWLPSPLPGLNLYGTLWLLLLAYLGRFLAFALQPISAAWQQLDSSLEEAAQIDGATLVQTFRFVLLPLIAPSILIAVLLVFLQAFAELTLSALLAGSGTETLGWLVFGLEQGGYTNEAAALGSLLVLALLGLAGLIAAVRRWAKRATA